MKILKKYDPTKTYMFPSGTIATPEVVKQKYPATAVFTHLIETDESDQVLFALQNLAAMRTMYDIDPTLTEDEAIAAISDILNAPQPEPGPSAEERIAAALEYQNLTNMEDSI